MPQAFAQIRAFALVGWGLVLCLAACAPTPPAAPSLPDAPTQERLATEARQALAELGRGRFEVLEFIPVSSRVVAFVDPLEFQSRYWSLIFRARIRTTAPLHVPRREEQTAAMRAPGWSVDRAFADLQLSALEPMNDVPAGSERTWQAAAMCLDLEPGWRFDQFDQVDREPPEAR